ncbi:MAG: CNNM domain-containing protein [Acidimicrobiia bacterium]|nr:CNNM domain-containing protein [Acidimicrobiia bacterium]
MSLVEPALMLVLVLCFLGAATLSVAEVSIIRVRRSEVLVDAGERRSSSRDLLELLDDLPVVLNSILLLVLLFQVCTATIGGFLAGRWFGGIGVTVATFAVTAVLFLYAEAVPKTVAVRSPKRMALRLTPLLKAVVRVLRPFVAVLVRLADLQSPGSTVSLGALTEEEIRALARESAAAGEIAEHDVVLVDRSFEFNDRSVGEVMVPRGGVRAVQARETVGTALTRAFQLGHRRLPVYRRDLDDIVGIVRLRDLAAIARDAPGTPAEAVATEALRCRADDPISELLTKMQRAGSWLAIVTDGSDRTVGLATVEDLVAELVGEIADERRNITARRRPDQNWS